MVSTFKTRWGGKDAGVKALEGNRERKA